MFSRLMFAYSCLSSLIQPVFGLLADRFSKPWFIPLGVLLAGGGLALVGFMSSYWAIFLALAVSGVGAALFHPEGARFANKVSGEQKGTGLSIFSIGGNSGFVLGPLLATGILSVFGLRGTTIFAAIAVVGGPAGKPVQAQDEPSGPCGVCRQVMQEFCGPDFEIHMQKAGGGVFTVKLPELLPFGFTKDSMEA